MCDYDISGCSGRQRATRQKVEALAELVDDLYLISPKKNKFKLFELLILEVKALIVSFKLKSNVLITRGVAGFLCIPFLKLFGVITIREVHSSGLQELRFMNMSAIKKIFVFFKLCVELLLDKVVDMRVFNHPLLFGWYKAKYKCSQYDFCVYNGAKKTAVSQLSRNEARKKFCFNDNDCYLVFVGGANKWHGVQYLVQLQKKFNEYSDPIKIVCGGGDISLYDPEGICVNISPLNDSDCADLIKAADLCLLPVDDIRVSPGSPLKLYDYIINKRYIVTQKDTLGYSDEVDLFDVGISVDFKSSDEARHLIVQYLSSFDLNEVLYPDPPVTWDDRMSLWVDKISLILK